MKLGFALGWLAACVALPMIGCLGASFVSTGGTSTGTGGTGGAGSATGTTSTTSTTSTASTTSTGSSGCPSPEVQCSNTGCTDLSNDKANCGSCGKVCGAGTTGCTSGGCACESGKTLCVQDLACYDFLTNHDHCGSCETKCAQNDTCAGGMCRCPGGGVDCGNGDCAVLAFSPTDCGKCGQGCMADQACLGGTCKCRPGLKQVPMVGCVDPMHDNHHCGPTDAVCPVTSACADGTCIDLLSCTTGGGKICGAGGGCYTGADLNVDPANCGACGVVCTVSQVCDQGMCQDFTVIPACTTSCNGGSTCCPYPGTTDDNICVKSNTCPM